MVYDESPIRYLFCSADLSPRQGGHGSHGPFSHSARRTLEDARPGSQTLRLATPPFTEVLGDPTAAQVVDLAQALEALCIEQGIDYISIGPLLADRPDTLLAPIYRLPDVFAATEHIFATVSVTAAAAALNLAAIRASAEIVPRIAQATPDGFGTLRFAALANCPPGSPFFPVAYHAGGPPSFAFATEAADLPVTAFGQAASLEKRAAA